jgi:acetolactate synthase-1/2/3 large subunit
VHVDIDASEINKNKYAHVPINTDLRAFLRAINPLVGPGNWRAWHQRIDEWRASEAMTYDQRNDVILPQYVLEQFSKLTDGEFIMATGVGQHQMWAAQWTRFKRPRTWITSGGLGSMGYGLPAAMGVAAAFPDRLVVNIDGDGSFVMNSQELATCYDENLAVKTVIINNGGHGMVRQWQAIIYKERYCAIDFKGSPDFVKLAEAYGCAGIRATRPTELLPALEKAFATPGPVVVDVWVDKWEFVFPMVPAGGANPDMILEPPTLAARERAARAQTGF